MLTTFKYADVSTIHITPEDDTILTKEAKKNLKDSGKIIVFPTDHGYFVYVPPKDMIEEYTEDFKKLGLSQEFFNVMLRAKNEHCVFVRFDSDGEKYADLPMMEW